MLDGGSNANTIVLMHVMMQIYWDHMLAFEC
jgi:hypothetical protein